jgi:hypothetical protein
MPLMTNSGTGGPRDDALARHSTMSNIEYVVNFTTIRRVSGIVSPILSTDERFGARAATGRTRLGLASPVLLNVDVSDQTSAR